MLENDAHISANFRVFVTKSSSLSFAAACVTSAGSSELNRMLMIVRCRSSRLSVTTTRRPAAERHSADRRRRGHDRPDEFELDLPQLNEFEIFAPNKTRWCVTARVVEAGRRLARFDRSLEPADPVDAGWQRLADCQQRAVVHSRDMRGLVGRNHCARGARAEVPREAHARSSCAQCCSTRWSQIGK